MSIVVNFFAGPGAGKSTTAAGVFTLLKLNHVNCELVTEFAKDLTWEKRRDALAQQLFIVGEQCRRLAILQGQVSVIVTDSPVILGVFYDPAKDEHLEAYLLREFKQYNNINFMIDRVKPFQQAGRSQSLEEAKRLDQSISSYLHRAEIPHLHIFGDQVGINSAALHILEHVLHQPKRFTLVPTK